MNINPWGTIRLYNLTNNSFTLGSWICLPGNNNKIAIKAWILCTECGFEKFKKNFCLLDVRKKNLNVLYYLKLFGPILIEENDLDYYFKLEKDTYFQKRNKVIELINFNYKSVRYS